MNNLQEQIKRMSHAFYSLVDILSDNLPDSDDEYANECREAFDDALEEFENAEKEAGNNF